MPLADPDEKTLQCTGNVRKCLQNSKRTPRDTLTFPITMFKWWNYMLTITASSTALQMKWGMV